MGLTQEGRLPRQFGPQILTVRGDLASWLVNGHVELGVQFERDLVLLFFFSFVGDEATDELGVAAARRPPPSPIPTCLRKSFQRGSGSQR